MSNLDDRIRESLATDDRELLAQLDADDSLYRDLIATFQGRMRWMNILSSIIGFVLFGVALACAWGWSTNEERTWRFDAFGVLRTASVAAVFAIGVASIYSSHAFVYFRF